MKALTFSLDPSKVEGVFSFGPFPMPSGCLLLSELLVLISESSIGPSSPSPGGVGGRDPPPGPEGPGVGDDG